MEDRENTHNMKIYPKICPSIWGCMNSSDRSLEDGPSVLPKAFTCNFFRHAGPFLLVQLVLQWKMLMRRNREVVDFKRYRVKNYT